MVNYLLPRSALQINTAPVMNALNGMRQQRNVDRSFEDSQSRYQQDMEFREAQANQAQENSLKEYNLRKRQFDANFKHQNDQIGLQQDRLKLERKRFGEESDARKQTMIWNAVQRAAGVAQSVAGERDPQRQAAMWAQFLSSHPRVANEILPRELHGDPVMGSQFVMAKARGYVDPNKGDFSKQPIYGTDASGRPIIMQLSPSGRAMQTQLPPGVTPSTGVERLDLGTEWVLLDKRSGRMVGTMRKDLEGAAAAKETGQSMGASRVQLPFIEGEARRINDYIDSVLNHPAFERSTSVLSGYTPSITPEARDFDQRVEQLKGKAFVAAFERLKGAGAITETEGAKAGQALARLQATSIGSENYKTALMDFNKELNALVEVARQRASGRNVGATAPASNPVKVITAKEAAALPIMTADQVNEMLKTGRIGKGFMFQTPNGDTKRVPDNWEGNNG